MLITVVLGYRGYLPSEVLNARLLQLYFKNNWNLINHRLTVDNIIVIIIGLITSKTCPVRSKTQIFTLLLTLTRFGVSVVRETFNDVDIYKVDKNLSYKL